MDILFLALLSGTGLTLTLLKLLGKNALIYDMYCDATITILLPILFGGGYHAMTLSILTGIVMSVELFILKKIAIHAKLIE